MELLLTDLVVRLSAETRQITFWTRQESKPDVLLRFYAHNIDEFKSMDSLASELGVALIAFFKSKNKDIFPDSDFLESIVVNGSEGLSFYDVRLLIDRVSDDSKIEDLEAIDMLLKEVAASGDPDAVQYLQETWPKLRDIFVRRIKRSSDKE